jgi:hypothetical protein
LLVISSEPESAMHSVASVLVVIFSACLVLWPAGFLVAAGLHSFARRWRQLGQIAWLVPLWSIAASIALVQFPRLMEAFEPAARPGLSLGGIAAVVFALCCAAIAWALLVRSLVGPAPIAHAS